VQDGEVGANFSSKCFLLNGSHFGFWILDFGFWILDFGAGLTGFSGFSYPLVAEVNLILSIKLIL
jgi:hypothetical protein